MGARVHRGEGEDALWELPTVAPATPPVQPKRPLAVRLGLMALVSAVVLVVLNALLATLTDTSLVTLISDMIPRGDAWEKCLKDAEFTMTEILECNKEHGPKHG